MKSLIHIIASVKQSGAEAVAANLPSVIADNIFKELRSSGLRDKDIVAVSSELIGRLRDDLEARQEARETQGN